MNYLGTFIGTESRFVEPEGMENEKLLFNWYRVYVGDDEKVWGLDNGRTRL